ncbi:MAG: AAA family ATPase, partial [Clostridia bacterium]|nr:AAA family ATPase [Clostridia bacterium]
MKKNKLTIDLYTILKDVILNIWVIILSGLIAAMSVYTFSHSIYKPEYTAKATLAVNASGSSYTQLTTSNEIAGILSNIFSETTVKSRAAEAAGQKSFKGTVRATVLSPTNFIELSVTSENPKLSYDLLTAVIEVHPQVTRKIFGNSSITVIRQPSVSGSPSNSAVAQNGNLIIIGSMTLALTAIVFLSIARNTIKTEADFNSKVEASLLVSIMHEDKRMSLKETLKKKKKGLLIHNNAFISLRFVENFRKAAAKLEYMKHKTGCSVFAITSVAENEGKSTCAANLAVSLADRGNKVILIDLDGKKPAIHKIFGEEHEENCELANLLNGTVAQSEYRFKRYKKSSLYISLNSKPCAEMQKWVENGEIKKLLNIFKQKSDFIIIDTAPITLDSSVSDIIKIVDKTLLVVRTDAVKAPAINDAIKVIDTVSKNLAGCILNDLHQKAIPFVF